MRCPGPGPGPQVGTHRKGSGQRNPETPRLPQLRFLPLRERQASSLPEQREDQELPLLSGQEGAGRAANRVGLLCLGLTLVPPPSGLQLSPVQFVLASCHHPSLTLPSPTPPHPTPALFPTASPPPQLPPVCSCTSDPDSRIKFDSGGDSPVTPLPRKTCMCWGGRPSELSRASYLHSV